MTAITSHTKRVLLSGFLITVACAGLAFAAPAFAQFGLDDTAGEVDGIGDVELPVLIGRIINVALGLVGTIFFILTVYAGFLWMTARGNDAQVKTAKGVLSSAILGLIIVGLAYAITSFIVSRVSDAVEQPSAFLISTAHAQGLGMDNLRDAGEGAGQSSSQTLPVLVGKIIQALIGVIGIIFVIYTVYAGYLWMTAGGDEKKVEDAKRIIKQGVIGMLVMLAAYGIAEFVVGAISCATMEVGCTGRN